MTLRYTEDVPTIPGFYFKRKNGVVSVLEMPYCGVWPRHWKVIKQESLDMMTSAGDEDTCQKLLELPDSAWLTEWAGPIHHPEN